MRIQEKNYGGGGAGGNAAARRGGSIGPPPASPPPPPPKVPPKVQSPRVYDDEESEYESLRREPRRVVQPTSRSPPPVPPQSRSPRAYDDEAESEYESLRRGIGGGAGRGRRGWDEGRMI
ncbi:hypothetical protein TUN205_05841 [Pyrenophora tritici-repentis]|nr:hypothetical protein TUN205_05841 [Pyrenophora tritici-repentis]